MWYKCELADKAQNIGIVCKIKAYITVKWFPNKQEMRKIEGWRNQCLWYMVKRGWKRKNVPRSDEEDEDADYAFTYTIEQIMNILKTIHLLETFYIVNISSALFTSAILKTLHSERFYCLQIHKNIIVISGGIDTGTLQSARDNNVYC